MGNFALMPLPTAAEMAAWDRATIDDLNISEAVLIESAGRAAAHVLHELYPTGTVVAGVGGGHNGADAMVMLRTLAAWGRSVVAVHAGDDSAHDGLKHGWEIPRAVPLDCRAVFGCASVIVDGLLGTGARGAPREGHLELIREMNRAAAPVVALDGPSGVDLTDGSILTEAVRADVTVSFGALKRGLCMFPGREHAGRIVVVEVGFPPFEPIASAAALITPGWARKTLPHVPANAHKGVLGTVVVLAGHPGMGGAAIMVGMGALRAGAGAVRIVSPSANRVSIQTALPEALFVDRAGPALGEVAEAADAMVVGPGMGLDDGARAVLGVVLAACEGPIVLDADALTLISWDPEILPAGGRERLLLTPHPGEMSRLLAVPTSEITADPFSAARDAAQRFGCTILLKGSPSIVASPANRTLVNLTGNSGVATGGMGDTLAGACGAFLAAGSTPRDAAALALYFCGRAAEIMGCGRSLLPRDVADALPRAFLGNGDARLTGCPEVVMSIPAPR